MRSVPKFSAEISFFKFKRNLEFLSRDYIEDLNLKVLLLYDALLNAGNAETSKSINHKVCIPYVQPCFKS